MPYSFWDAVNQRQNAPPDDPPSVVSIRPPGSDITAYANAALMKELDKLRATGEGSRNDQLNKAAFALGQLVAGGELPAHDVGDLLAEAARDIGLDPREIMATLRSGMNAGAKHPRQIPPLNGATIVESKTPPVPEDGGELGPNGQVANQAQRTSNEAVDESDQTSVDRRYLQLVAALLDIQGLHNIVPPSPLVADYLFLNSLAWLGGKPGHGKSFVAVELACCIATGASWHGHKTTQGTVLYLIAEGVSGFSLRIDAWLKEHNQTTNNIRFLPVPVQMMQPIDVAAFGQLLNDINPTLVVLDTQARVTVGAEENSSKDMGQFVDALELLRRQSGACILIVHHEPRIGENLRGSTALEGAATTIIRTSKDGNQITIFNPKQKDTSEREPMQLALESREESAVLVRSGLAHTSLSDSSRRVLTVLEEFGDKWVSKTTLREAVGFSSTTTFYRAVNDLAKRGLVLEREDGKNRCSYKLPDDSDRS